MRDHLGHFVGKNGQPGNGTKQPSGEPGREVDDIVDPATIATAAPAPSEPEPPRKKRGWHRRNHHRAPSGDGTAKRTAAKEEAGASLDLSAAAGLLSGAHALIAMRRGPHWLLTDADAKAYGTALKNALQHLPITVGQKYLDFATLGIAIAHYDGVRLAEDYRLRHRPPPAPGAVVYPFPFTPRAASAPGSPGGGSATGAPSPSEAAPPLGGSGVGEAPIVPDMTEDLGA
jgi:hypothetical protein